MEPQRSTKMMQIPPLHCAIGTEAPFRSVSPAVMSDDGVFPAIDRRRTSSDLHSSINVCESVSNVFASLNISPTANIHRRTFLPENIDGEGSVQRFHSNASVRALNAGNSHQRGYSSVGQTNPVAVDPHHHYHSHQLWRNRDVPQGIRSSGFDQPFDFDQSSLPCSSNSINDNLNLASSKFQNHQVLSFLSLIQLRGRICSLAKDQNGCRILQAKFENPTQEEIEIVLNEVINSINDLMKDQFGNYLIQKLVSVCNDEQKSRILLSLTDFPVEMILVCMNPHGTRSIQKFLENLTDPYQIAVVMAALRPGAARLANDPNGHHVIQHCLLNFSSDVNEPILNEIADKCFEVATDRSGCCVLQACVEHSCGEVRNRLVSEILSNSIHLAEDPYGNYVLQHMVGLKVPEFTFQLVRELKGNFTYLSCNKYASNVVEKCLNESGEEISNQIVMELIRSPNPSLLLMDPYANFVIQSALNVSKGFVYDCLVELISDNMWSMRSNLYGKKILAWFEKRKILCI